MGHLSRVTSLKKIDMSPPLASSIANDNSSAGIGCHEPLSPRCWHWLTWACAVLVWALTATLDSFMCVMPLPCLGNVWSNPPLWLAPMIFPSAISYPVIPKHWGKSSTNVTGAANHFLTELKACSKPPCPKSLLSATTIENLANTTPRIHEKKKKDKKSQYQYISNRNMGGNKNNSEWVHFFWLHLGLLANLGLVETCIRTLATFSKKHGQVLTNIQIKKFSI